MKLRLVSAALVTSTASITFAGLGPEETVVVVNGKSWASLTVANEYSKLRQIPASHVVVLDGITSFDVTDVDRFRTEVLGPVLTEIAARGLTGHIDCITYSVDVPYAATTGSDMTGRTFPQVITGMASANGLTYLNEWVMKKDPDYLRLDINRYARKLLPLPTGSPLSREEQSEYARGVALYDAKKYVEGAQVLGKLVSVPRSDANVAYNCACCLALAGKADDAMAALQMAVKSGWRNYGQTTSDPDLSSLAGREDFKALVAGLKNSPIVVQPGASFRAASGWSVAGAPSAEGPHYMLSTMLGVTCGRGNSVQEVIDGLRRAKSADFTAPKGTIYFPKNGDVRSTTREWGFQPASDALKKIGVNAVVENGVLPNHHPDVAGAMIGISDFDWNSSGSKILPGAIIEHLTSFGGIITERAGQSPCTDFIRAGATASSGTVTEPFALQEKFPTPFMHLQYAKGWTMAESFYQSLSGPYQLLIVGDPMCQPWGTRGSISITKPVAGTRASGTLSVSASGSPASKYRLFADGKLKATSGNPNFTLDTRTLANGSHRLTVEAILKNVAETTVSASTEIVVAGAEVPTATYKVNPDGSMRFQLQSRGAQSIALYQFGRPIGKCQGSSGNVTVTSTTTGFGPVELQPVATVNGRQVFGKPILINVSQPAAIKPAEDMQTPTRGLRLSNGDGTSSVVTDTIDGGWLAKMLKPNQTAMLNGYFQAEDDLYQLDIKTNCQVTVEIDDQPIAEVKSEQESLFPVRLAAGKHALRIHCIAGSNAPTLEVQFGNKGRYHLSGDRFTCR